MRIRNVILLLILVYSTFISISEARTQTYWDSVNAISSSTSFYDVLKVKNSASQQEIKKAFRKLSLEFHPDRNPSAEAKESYLKITLDFQVLGDADSREEYDHLLKHGIPFQDKYYGRYAKAAGIPPHNPFIVYPVIFIVFTIISHILRWNNHLAVTKRIKKSQEYKKQRKQAILDAGKDPKKIKKLRKEQGLNSDDEDEFSPNIHVYGAEKPTYLDLLPIAIVIGIYKFFRSFFEAPLSPAEQMRQHMELRDRKSYTLEDAEYELKMIQKENERIKSSNKYRMYLKRKQKLS